MNGEDLEDGEEGRELFPRWMMACRYSVRRCKGWLVVISLVLEEMRYQSSRGSKEDKHRVKSKRTMQINKVHERVMVDQYYFNIFSKSPWMFSASLVSFGHFSIASCLPVSEETLEGRDCPRKSWLRLRRESREPLQGSVVT